MCVSLKHTSISTCMCESDAICIERLHMCGLSSFSNTQVEILSHMVAIYIVLVKKRLKTNPKFDLAHHILQHTYQKVNI